MKKKNGFTLIELLAIIVILAIIAVITTPIILEIIDNSKKGAAKDSAYGYKDSINKFYVSKLSEDSSYNIPNDVYTVSELKTNGVDYSGQEPGNNSRIAIYNNKVISGCLEFGDYKVYISNGEIGDPLKGQCEEVFEFNGTYVAAQSDETHKGIVYLDPTDLTAQCDAAAVALNVNEYGTPTGIYDGCMKFYIYDDNGDGTVDMIVDHNTSGNVAWNSSGSNSSMVEADDRLKDDTQGWEGNPRLIGADEIAHIVGADRDDTIKWDKTKEYADPVEDTSINSGTFSLDGTGTTYSNVDGWRMPVLNSESKSRYAWLYDYTYDCVSRNCNVSDNNAYPKITKDNSSKDWLIGYWTSDRAIGSYAGFSNYVWRVGRGGGLSPDISNDTSLGVRPVITLSKMSLGIYNY